METQTKGDRLARLETLVERQTTRVAYQLYETHDTDKTQMKRLMQLRDAYKAERDDWPIKPYSRVA